MRWRHIIAPGATPLPQRPHLCKVHHHVADELLVGLALRLGKPGPEARGRAGRLGQDAAPARLPEVGAQPGVAALLRAGGRLGGAGRRGRRGGLLLVLLGEGIRLLRRLRPALIRSERGKGPAAGSDASADPTLPRRWNVLTAGASLSPLSSLRMLSIAATSAARSRRATGKWARACCAGLLQLMDGSESVIG